MTFMLIVFIFMNRFCQLIGFNGLKSRFVSYLVSICVTIYVIITCIDSVRQEFDPNANGLSEELSALKASKGMIETEVKALRDQIKDSNHMNVKDVKDLRQELMSLKALNETMICENKELTRELMSLNIRFKTCISLIIIK